MLIKETHCHLGVPLQIMILTSVLQSGTWTAAVQRPRCDPTKPLDAPRAPEIRQFHQVQEIFENFYNFSFYQVIA